MKKTRIFAIFTGLYLLATFYSVIMLVMSLSTIQSPNSTFTFWLIITIFACSNFILFSKLDSMSDNVVSLEQRVNELESDKRKEKFQNK